MLIRNAEVSGKLRDVRISPERAGGIITEIGIGLSGETSFGAKGCALIAGLHDHHIHLNAAAAAMNSVKCGPPFVETQAELIAALNAAFVTNSGTGFLRGVGYHHSVAGEIDREWLDRFGPDCPIRIQHRSGRLWILNSAALRALSMPVKGDGRLLDQDQDIRRRSEYPDLKPLISKLLSWGVTGVTEVTPSNERAEYAHYLSAARPLRLCVMGGHSLSGALSGALSEPSSGMSSSGVTGEAVGPLKLHYHDHDLPSLDFLSGEIEKAHAAGRNIAAHCVTRAELMLTLAAIEQAGAVKGDRIEHAAIADAPAIAWMKALGVIVVTQPNFIAERITAYLKDVPKNEHENLWRLKAFTDAGLAVAAGSDAPFGDPNPWAAMGAAVNRPAGFEHEAISPEQALALYTKPAKDAGAPPREIEVGGAADMCLLDRSWAQACTDFSRVKVKATWIAGETVYQAG